MAPARVHTSDEPCPRPRLPRSPPPRSSVRRGRRRWPAQNPTLIGNVGPEFTISLHTAPGAPRDAARPGHIRRSRSTTARTSTTSTSRAGVQRAYGASTSSGACVDGDVRGRDLPCTAAIRIRLHGSSPPATRTAAAVRRRQHRRLRRPGTITAEDEARPHLGPGPDHHAQDRGTGGRVKQLKVGTYRVTVRDRSRTHNAHLVAPGYNRADHSRLVGHADVERSGSRRAGTLRFLCDPHASTGMKGSAKIIVP